ncbi:B12-binding domain-containing radical SAM protein [Myxococcus xanthus]|uniref:B12-binding domain-containing radical SAM protein n=1 Tax=Myxococcus xanthus TaxID=34 RepID=UPI00112B6FBC|nr:radical SAM protein [Myxococcus xanthus]
MEHPEGPGGRTSSSDAHAPGSPSHPSGRTKPPRTAWARGGRSAESARGCKFKCTFCSTRFLGSWRGVSAGNFVDRLERLQPYLKRTRYKVFSIIDDLYTLDIQRVADVTRELKRRGMKIQATLDARATDVIRGEVCEALAPITNDMLIGAECGYDEGLKKIAKGCTTKVLERAAAMLQEVGLSHKCVCSFVIGFPFETREDCLRTIEFASKLLVKYNVRVYLQWYNTIPGSAIWEELAGKGLVSIGLFHAPTVDFPSHGVLENGARPESPRQSDVAGLVGLRRGKSRAAGAAPRGRE